MLREYSGNARQTRLVGDVTSSATSAQLVDGTGYPTGATAPFVVAFDLGLAGEEKVLATRSGNSLTLVQRGFDGTTASLHGNGSTVDHVLSATDIREANAHIADLNDPHPQYLTPTEGNALYSPTVHSHPANAVVKTVRVSHTFTISGEVKVAVGDDFYIPPFFMSVPLTQTTKLTGARYVLSSGTSATVDVRVAGSPVTGFTGLVVTPSENAVDPADISISDGQRIALVVTAVSGTPKNATVTLYFEHTV